MNYRSIFGKLPRKKKKKILGRRLNKTKLRSLLQSVEIVNPSRTCYEAPEIKPYLFCPKCGCRGVTSTGNMTSYPEHWEYFYCMRCGKKVGEIDNSPFTHVLEMKEENYEL